MRKKWFFVLMLAVLIVPVTYAAGEPPVAVGDTYTTGQGQVLIVNAPGVLANDFDPDANPITTGNFLAPTHGELTLNPGGSFSYTPDADFQGVDFFRYRATDGDLFSEFATVTIIVGESPNRPPVGLTNSYWTDVNENVVVASPGVLANDYDPDGDPIAVKGFVPPANGSVGGLQENGAFTYDPNEGFTGIDTWFYIIEDQNGAASQRVPVTMYVGMTPGVEGLDNGSFEVANTSSAALPAGWNGNGLSSDARVCDKPNKDKFFAQQGRCAFRFIGVPGEFSILAQKVSPGQVAALGEGDTLTLNAYVKPIASVAGGRMQIIVVYQNSALGRDKAGVQIPSGVGEYRVISTPTLTLKGQPKQVRVKIRYTGTSGAFLLDSVSLAKNGTAVPLFMPESIDLPANDEVIPLPAPATTP